MNIMNEVRPILENWREEMPEDRSWHVYAVAESRFVQLDLNERGCCVSIALAEDELVKAIRPFDIVRTEIGNAISLLATKVVREGAD